jgi:hypothetical protein
MHNIGIYRTATKSFESSKLHDRKPLGYRYEITHGIQVYVNVLPYLKKNSVADPEYTNFSIPDPGPKRDRIPDPDLQQTIYTY